MSQSRSAEWLEGAVTVLDECLEKGFNKQRHDHYRQLLAAAEAREARPLPEVLDEMCTKLEEIAGAREMFCNEHDVPGCIECINDTANDALATIAAYRDGTAEVIEALEWALENVPRGDDEQHHSVDCTCADCDNKRGYEKIDRAIAALRGGKG